MRGKVLIRKLVQCRLGITPAYAGKSHHVTLCTFLLQDHPRLCGEKFLLICPAFSE